MKTLIFAVLMAVSATAQISQFPPQTAPLPGISTVTSSATPAFNPALGYTQKMTVTANITAWAVTNGSYDGQKFCLNLKNDATGGYTMPAYTSSGAPATGMPTNVTGWQGLNPLPNARTAQCFQWDTASSVWYATDSGLVASPITQ